MLCFSHLRWDFVYQRPQHLMKRYQKLADVFFIEEPVFGPVAAPEMADVLHPEGVRVLTPRLPWEMQQPANSSARIHAQRFLLDEYLAARHIRRFTAWFYTPMALEFSSHLSPEVTVYDCMDELSAFDGAPPEMARQEFLLFDRADVVFTGGHSLYEVKRKQHANVHAFPSSIDRDHFATARTPQPDLPDQQAIPHPRIGFFGVLDERLDRQLLKGAAELRPDWHFILVGPVVKISEDDLPRAANIHYLGKKQYSELPAYLANWDVAMLPFAQNASTRFISPTKTPEYLAAGKPVVSTPIRDVVRPYGESGLVHIAADVHEFTAAIDASLRGKTPGWLPAVDRMLAGTSWDRTFEGMRKEITRFQAQTESQNPAGDDLEPGVKKNDRSEAYV